MLVCLPEDAHVLRACSTFPFSYRSHAVVLLAGRKSSVENGLSLRIMDKPLKTNKGIMLKDLKEKKEEEEQQVSSS